MVWFDAARYGDIRLDFYEGGKAKQAVLKPEGWIDSGADFLSLREQGLRIATKGIMERLEESRQLGKAKWKGIQCIFFV